MDWVFTGRERELARLGDVLARPRGRGTVIAGDAGVGKSRLLAELARRGDEAGFAVSRFSASVATTSIPLGAFAELVPHEAALDEAGLLRRMHQSLRHRAGGLPVLVVVDDAHALDRLSVALVHHLATSSDARVALSIRSDQAVPGAITTLWKDEHLDRIDLGPLVRDEFAFLLEQVLGPSVPPPVERRLWETTLGHPLYLRLLVDAAVETGALGRHDGTWRWDHAPTYTPAITELVGERTAGLDAAAREALEVLALAEPVPEAVADALVPRGVRAGLEARGLVGYTDHDDGPTLRTAHPLFAEIVVAGLGSAQRRAYASRLADAWADSAAPEALLNSARWQLEAQLTLPAPIAENAARAALARFDFPLAERLAVAGLADRDDATLHFLAAEACRHQTRGEAAAKHLERAAVLAQDDALRVEVALTRAKTEAMVNHQPARALASLRRTERAVRDPDGRRRLAAERTYIGAFAGDLRHVARSRPGAPPEGAPAAVPGTTPILVEAYARALSLQLDGLDTLVERGLAVAAGRRNDAPHASHLLGVARTLARIGQGRAAEAFALATSGAEAARTEPVAAALWSYVTAFTGSFTGDLDRATDAALEARRRFDEGDPFGLGETCAVVCATTAVQAGRADDATRLTRSVPPWESSGSARVRAVLDSRVAAWQVIAAGAHEDGARIAVQAGQTAVAVGERLWGAIALYDAVRVGRPELAVDDLRVLHSTTDSPLVELFTSHAVALHEEHQQGLEQAAQELRRAGCRLFAAEAEAQASTAAMRAGDHVASTRTAMRARLLAETCAGPVLSPALDACPAGLTDREREVAHLAVGGASSRAIAERLFLSVRTVDNHLRRAYRRLGVNSRAQLGAVLSVSSN